MIARIFSNAGLTVVGRALTLGTTVLVARMLGPAEYGRYAVAVTLLVMATFPAMTGLPDLIVREVAGRSTGKERRTLWAILRPALELSALITAVLSAVYLACLLLAPLIADVPDTALALVVVAIIPVFVLRTLLCAVMRGLDRVALAIVPTELVQPALLLALLVLILPDRAEQAFYALAAAFLFSALVAIALILRIWPDESPSATNSPLARGYLFRAGLPFAAIGVLSLVNQRIDLVILSGFVPAAEIGLYGLAVQLAFIAQLPMAIANGVIAPQVATLYQRGDKAALAVAMRQVSGLLALVGIAGFLAFWQIGRLLVAFAFGPEFTDAYPLVLILLAGQMINLASGPLGAFLNFTGNERSTLGGVGLAAVVAVTGSFALIPFFGGVGAAVASFLAMASVNIYLSVRVWRTLGIMPGLAGLLLGWARPG